jgi:hypothetical protein
VAFRPAASACPGPLTESAADGRRARGTPRGDDEGRLNGAWSTEGTVFSPIPGPVLHLMPALQGKIVGGARRGGSPCKTRRITRAGMPGAGRPVQCLASATTFLILATRDVAGYQRPCSTNGRSTLKPLLLCSLSILSPLAAIGIVRAEDITVAVAGPMTESVATIGEQLRHGA